MPATETVDNEEKLCLDCGKPLGPGKLGKKYCDEYCKSNYHNRANREKRQLTSAAAPAELTMESIQAPEQVITYAKHFEKINEVLVNNWLILADLCNEDRPRRIPLRELLGRGFNIKFFTSQADPTREGHVYRFCYEYGYRMESEDSVIVICRPREILF